MVKCLAFVPLTTRIGHYYGSAFRFCGAFQKMSIAKPTSQNKYCENSIRTMLATCVPTDSNTVFLHECINSFGWCMKSNHSRAILFLLTTFYTPTVHYEFWCGWKTCCAHYSGYHHHINRAYLAWRTEACTNAKVHKWFIIIMHRNNRADWTWLNANIAGDLQWTRNSSTIHKHWRMICTAAIIINKKKQQQQQPAPNRSDTLSGVKKWNKLIPVCEKTKKSSSLF